MNILQLVERVARPIMFALICGLFTAVFTTLLTVYGSHNVRSLALVGLFLAAIGQFVSQETEQGGQGAQAAYKVAVVSTRASLIIYLFALIAFVMGL